MLSRTHYFHAFEISSDAYRHYLQTRDLKTFLLFTGNENKEEKTFSSNI
jgi:hypothetical protein